MQGVLLINHIGVRFITQYSQHRGLFVFDMVLEPKEKSHESESKLQIFKFRAINYGIKVLISSHAFGRVNLYDVLWSSEMAQISLDYIMAKDGRVNIDLGKNKHEYSCE